MEIFIQVIFYWEEDGKLKILGDFDRYDIGDPWEEFNGIDFLRQICPAFARGQVDAPILKDTCQRNFGTHCSLYHSKV